MQNQSRPNNKIVPPLIGCAIGTAIATLLGTPLTAIVLLASVAAAYSLGWRILVVRKRRE